MSAAHYAINVEGTLEQSRWSRWFEGMEVQPTDDGNTTITGLVTDQAALHGLLAKVRDLGLVLIAVERVGSRPSSRSEFEEGVARDASSDS